jgi:hypothetical protein
LYAKKLCNSHYKRKQRTGDVQAGKSIGERVVRICSVNGCDNVATERGWCHGHYLRFVRLGDVQPERPLDRRVNHACTVHGCPNDATARGLCCAHQSRQRKKGTVQADRPIRKVAGTGYVHHTGYFIIPVPPELRWLTNGETSAPEHRLKMAKLLGRPLLPGESVHHVNGNRLDSRTNGPLKNFRSGNLELWSTSQPSGQRVRDKLEWARDFMRKYAPQELIENALF